jgi:hypothetical protein
MVSLSGAIEIALAMPSSKALYRETDLVVTFRQQYSSKVTAPEPQRRAAPSVRRIIYSKSGLQQRSGDLFKKYSIQKVNRDMRGEEAAGDAQRRKANMQLVLALREKRAIVSVRCDAIHAPDVMHRVRERMIQFSRGYDFNSELNESIDATRQSGLQPVF